MSGKNVALRREAVAVLDALKRTGESYSDVVVRLGEGRRSLAELAEFLSAMPPIDDEDLPRRVDRIRRDARRSWAGRVRR